MQVFKVDLYEYFNIDRNGAAGGILTAYIHENSREIDLNRKYPAMVVIPGGGYEMVSDREAEPIALFYFENLFDSFVLNYSVRPSKYPTQLTEAAMAMLYVRQNSDKLHISDKVAAIGFSAGGHLCGCLATMFDDENLMRLFPDKSAEIRPDAVVMAYAVVTSDTKTHYGTMTNVSGGDAKLAEKLSVEKRVTANSSPAYIWHTYSDNCVPVYCSLCLAEAYERNKVPFSLHIYENGEHGLSLADKRVYGTPRPISTGLQNWAKESVYWLSDRGFEVE